MELEVGFQGKNIHISNPICVESGLHPLVSVMYVC